MSKNIKTTKLLIFETKISLHLLLIKKVLSMTITTKVNFNF